MIEDTTEPVEQWVTAEVCNAVVALGLDRSEQHPALASTVEGRPLIVGLNEELVGIDLETPGIVFRVSFDAPFFEFLAASPDGVAALFETGVLMLAPDGRELRRVETDVVVGWEREGDVVTLSCMDGPTARVELALRA